MASNVIVGAAWKRSPFCSAVPFVRTLNCGGVKSAVTWDVATEPVAAMRLDFAETEMIVAVMAFIPSTRGNSAT